jgi:DNA-binding CsgD family transcriptional regulator
MTFQLLGLEDSDETVYRHHIACPVADTKERARATGLSESVIESSRCRLIGRGLLRLESSGQVKVIPDGPAALAKRFQSEIDAEHARKSSDLVRMESELTRLINNQILAGSDAPDPRIHRIPTQDAAVVRLTELICNAKVEVGRISPGTTRPWNVCADPVIAAQTKAAHRGVAVRDIRSPSELLDPLLRRSMKDLMRADVRIRVISALDIELLIVDRSVAILADFRRTSEYGGLLVRDGLLVHMMHRIFGVWWVQATDISLLLTGHGTSRPDGITEEEIVMLRLLSDGYKDEIVARKLGISVRTLRRKISDVMRRMPADSRFQAGVLAARRGWI